MNIILTSVFVDDQDKALEFYTNVLGFQKKTEIPMGEFRWLTVIDDPDAGRVELVLEPSSHPAVGPYRQALVGDGIPAATFGVENIAEEHDRLRAAGVEFTQPPTAMGPVQVAVFDDTCGNLIQLVQQ